MTGWYEVSKNDKGQYSFVLKAANAQVVLRSEQYEAKASALNGVASVQKNSPLDERYELKTASDGRLYFNLKAGNAQVIGTSQMYASEATRTTGIESVKTNGSSADIRDALSLYQDFPPRQAPIAFLTSAQPGRFEAAFHEEQFVHLRAALLHQR